ncbi:MAG: glycosyltransferase family 4 protein [Candidatus Omnitrophica bacterium]|nr:glycosyltransferase family 4 protein [Candidatus Omnitrophota bacterium]
MMDKVRVLHIITRLIIGGAQENTLWTVKGLMKLDRYDVKLISGPPLGPEGSLVEEAKKDGVHLIIFPQLRRAINPFLDAMSLLKLYRFIKKERIQIVHTHSSKAGILGRLAARFARVPVIIHTIHGLPFHPYQNKALNWLYRKLERLAGSWTTKIITVSDAMLEGACSAGVAPREKFITIYSGIETEKFVDLKCDVRAIKARLGVPVNAPVVGKIARLFPLKGHEYLMEAAPLIVKEFPDVRFLLIGDGILKEELRNEAKRLGILDNFVFAGLIPPDNIPPLIYTMDILVHTSLREGLARAIPQALLCAKPVVTFDIDGAREVVQDGKTGHIIAPKDTKALAEKVISLLKDRTKSSRFGEEGKRIAAPLFGVDTMVERIDAVYRELI